jgi:hypothetical protein
MSKSIKLLALGTIAVLAACSSEKVDRGSNAVKGEAAFTPFTGAIFTTVKDGSKVNANHYKDCRDVYLNGGPKGGGPGLPAGDYYFMVTSPSGGPPSMLLSEDALAERKVRVGASGEIESYLGNTHDTGTDLTGGGMTVQLWPFSATPNPGGEYKAWLTPVDMYSAADGTFGFVHRWSKTDNFKCERANIPGDAGPPPDTSTPPDEPCDNDEC